MYHIFSFQFQPTPTNNAVPGPREQVEIGYQMLIQEREENRIRNLQNQQEKAPENVENNETAKGSRRKSAEKRITFDLRQLKLLEGYFQEGLTHPNAETRDLLAGELGISSLGQAAEVEAHSIQTWFQNRRQKVKNPERDKKAKAVLDEVDRSEASSPEVKFIYSEKATKFCEIFTLLLTKVW